MVFCFIADSEKVRSEVQHTANISYGSSDIETMDLFVPDHLPKGITEGQLELPDNRQQLISWYFTEALGVLDNIRRNFISE